MTRAFTLVEMLVALGILLMLGAILFVVAAPSRERALESECRNKLGQIGKAYLLYQVDNPDGPAVPELDGFVMPHFPPHYALLAYLKDRHSLVCPCASSEQRNFVNTYFLASPGAFAADFPGRTHYVAEANRLGRNFPLALCDLHEYRRRREAGKDVSPIFRDPFLQWVNLDNQVQSRHMRFVVYGRR